MRSRIKKMRPTAFFDIGHAKIRLALLSCESSSLEVAEIPCEGFTKGKVTDPTIFSAAISDIAKQLNLNQLDHDAVVNVPSLHTRTIHRVVQLRCSGTYRSTDLFSLQDSSSESNSTDLDEVVDVLYTNFTLDDKAINPFGFGLAGREIKATALLATHPKLLLADILSCMNAAGIEVAEFRSNAFGLARAQKILRPEAENCVMLDIGHSSTTGVVSIGGNVQQTFCFAAGSHHMTRDMAIGLQLDSAHAESIKLASGLADGASVMLDANKDHRFYLRPRVAEILSLAAKNFAIYTRALDGGILFCGDGAQLLGLSAFSQKTLSLTAPPFICHLSPNSAESFLGCKIVTCNSVISSGWLGLLSQIKEHVAEVEALRFEREAKPLSRLRPLWTWLSELSR